MIAATITITMRCDGPKCQEQIAVTGKLGNAKWEMNRIMMLGGVDGWNMDNDDSKHFCEHCAAAIRRRESQK